MKKVMLIVLLVISIACLSLWVKGNSMREVRTEIEISASITDVWNILIEFGSWPEWSPIINQASGDAFLGSTLSITMAAKDKGKDGPRYSPVIIILDAPRTFRWRAKMFAGFLFTNDKVFELVETSSGTRLIHRELFSGMLVPIFWSSVQNNVPSMLDSMNEALKIKAEKSSG